MSAPYYAPVPQDRVSEGVTYFHLKVLEILPPHPNCRRPGEKELRLLDTETGKEKRYTTSLSTFLEWIDGKRRGVDTELHPLGWFLVDRWNKPPRRRIDTDEGSFRKRRGRLVRIPDKWVGQVAHPQTIRKRDSKKGQGRRFKRKVMR